MRSFYRNVEGMRKIWMPEKIISISWKKIKENQRKTERRPPYLGEKEKNVKNDQKVKS